jgi:hypothetical protein
MRFGCLEDRNVASLHGSDRSGRSQLDVAERNDHTIAAFREVGGCARRDVSCDAHVVIFQRDLFRRQNCSKQQG